MAQLPMGIGASTQDMVQSDRAPVKYSHFDLSRVINLTADYGMIVPFDFLYTFPNDNLDIGTEISLQSFPQVTNVLTPVKLTVEWYHCTLDDLFEGAEVLITKGRRNNLSLKVPRFADSYILPDEPALPINAVPLIDSDKAVFFGFSHSLSSYLGAVPSFRGTSFETIEGSDERIYKGFYLPYSVLDPLSVDDFVDSVNDTGYVHFAEPVAFPYVMYQNISKYHFCNPNLLDQNLALFPQKGDFDWRLPYSAGDGVSVVDMAGHNFFSEDLKILRPDCYSNQDTTVPLGLLRYCLWQNDRFTTGLLSPTRGTPPSLMFDISDISATLTSSSGQINLSNPLELRLNNEGTGPYSGVRFRNGLANKFNGSSYSLINDDDTFVGNDGNDTVLNFDSISNINVSIDTSGASADLSMASFREWVALNVFMERNAKINGDYNSFVEVQWNTNPHHTAHVSRFLGGYTDMISFDETIQTSQSTESSPMASSAGRNTARNGKKCGHLSTNDYGLLMGVLYIQPETVYEVGVSHEDLCWNTFEDIPLPAFEQLSMEPVYNGEIYYGLLGTGQQPKGLFAWQNRNAYLKSRENINRGLFQCSAEKDLLFASSTIKHLVDSSNSVLSDAFVRMIPSSVSRYHLSYPEYPAFKLSIASRITGQRALSFSSKPATFGF